MNDRSRRLSRCLLPALVATAALISGCTGGSTVRQRANLGVQDTVAHKGRSIYFAFNDPKDDDKGPGTYEYPLYFENREGFCDIERFTVEDGGSNVIFTIRCRRPIPRRRDDGSTEAKGWWLQLIDIYIDKDHKKGSGYTRALPGRNVVFDDRSAWEQVVLVTPNNSRTVEKIIEGRTSDMDLVRLRHKIIVPHRVTPKGFEFHVVVPKYEIGEPQPGWGYQCLVLAFNERNLSRGQLFNEEVVKFATNSRFGGGSDYSGNPNVIDMLAPSAAQQYRQLGDFISRPYSGDDRWARISCVYGDEPPAAGQAQARAGVSNRQPAASSGRASKQPPATFPEQAAGDDFLLETGRWGVKASPDTSPGGPHDLGAGRDGKEQVKQENRYRVHSFEGGF